MKLGCNPEKLHHDFLKSLLERQLPHTVYIYLCLKFLGKGAPGMKPFSPEIEREVLLILRERKIWPCFEDTGVRIGIRGCNLIGFWESVHIEADSPPSANRPKRGSHSQQIGVDAIEPLDGVYESLLGQRERNKSEAKKLKKNPDVPYFTSKMFNHNEKIYGRAPCTEEEKKTNSSSLFEAHEVSSDEIADVFECLANFVSRTKQDSNFQAAEEEISTLLKKFSEAVAADGFVKERLGMILDFMPKKHLLMFLMSFYKCNGFDPLYPKQTGVTWKLGNDVGLKYLLSRDFYIPAAQERAFQKNKAVGICFADFATYTIIDVDSNCREIYRGNIAGQLSITTRVHKVQSVLYLHEQLSELMTSGVAWTRSIEYRCDKTIMVLLNRYTMLDINSNSAKVEHQDVTEQFSHLL